MFEPLVRKCATILQERLGIQAEMIEVNGRLIVAQRELLDAARVVPKRMSETGEAAFRLALDGLAKS